MHFLRILNSLVYNIIGCHVFVFVMIAKSAARSTIVNWIMEQIKWNSTPSWAVNTCSVTRPWIAITENSLKFWIPSLPHWTTPTLCFLARGSNGYASARKPISNMKSDWCGRPPTIRARRMRRLITPWSRSWMPSARRSRGASWSPEWEAFCFCTTGWSCTSRSSTRRLPTTWRRSAPPNRLLAPASHDARPPEVKPPDLAGCAALGARRLLSRQAARRTNNPRKNMMTFDDMRKSAKSTGYPQRWRHLTTSDDIFRAPDPNPHEINELTSKNDDIWRHSRPACRQMSS